MLLETIATGHAPLDMHHLDGKTAVITGAASGIGLALARRLKAEGMTLVLADQDRAALDSAAGELGAHAVLTDIRDPESVRALADAAVAQCGGAHLLCSNAGVSRMAGIERLTLQDWRWLFDVNLFGAVNVVNAFLPILKANPDGAHILFTASLSSFYPTRAQAAYGATKYALAAFGETLALELQAEQARVGVTLLCPGPVRTNIGTGYGKRAARYRTPAPAPDAGLDVHEQAFRDETFASDWTSADHVADAALAGLRRGELWVITHPDLMSATRARHAGIEQAAERAAQRQPVRPVG
ncbi:MAG: SDR family NAD(P)-dependent oxidoreductase [Sphingomonadales bacterium]|nr:SDR family NAD(P)-dependent oxidoreductase [Sphingomonadales bacterium]